MSIEGEEEGEGGREREGGTEGRREGRREGGGERESKREKGSKRKDEEGGYNISPRLMKHSKNPNPVCLDRVYLFFPI